MPRPAKWKSPTVAVRVPERFADELLAIARAMDEGLPSDSSQRSVQNILEGQIESGAAQIAPEEGQSLAIGDRVRIVELAGRNPKWLHAEALVVEAHPRISIRVWNEEMQRHHVFFWSAEGLEKIELPSQGFVQNSDDDLVDHLVDKMLARCEEQGIPPEGLLLRMKLNELTEFLSQFREQDRKEFVVRLMDQVFKFEAA